MISGLVQLCESASKEGGDHTAEERNKTASVPVE
jgi:hypothetical protein